MESSCECSNEPSDSIKCWQTIEWLHGGGLSGSAQLHRVHVCLCMCVCECERDCVHHCT
jgi:hypothetical protein